MLRHQQRDQQSVGVMALLRLVGLFVVSLLLSLCVQLAPNVRRWFSGGRADDDKKCPAHAKRLNWKLVLCRAAGVCFVLWCLVQLSYPVRSKPKKLVLAIERHWDPTLEYGSVSCLARMDVDTLLVFDWESG